MLSLHYAPALSPKPKHNLSGGETNTSTDAGKPGPARRMAILLRKGLKDAVERNRLKRRLREIYRRHKDWFPIGDCLILVTPQAASLEYGRLLERVEALTVRLRNDLQST